jgi:ATP-dependent RNA helicase UAP56/SUB2
LVRLPTAPGSIKRYTEFKGFSSRILVTTDLFGRGIDIERVNVVINYDFPQVCASRCAFAAAAPRGTACSKFLMLGHFSARACCWPRYAHEARAVTEERSHPTPLCAQETGREGDHASDSYIHRVGRAGRFGTPGLAISFVSSPEDDAALGAVQSRFELRMPELPDKIEQRAYMRTA